MAHVDIQVAAPVIRHPFKDKLVSEVHLGNAVGSIAERWLHGGGIELPNFPVVLRQGDEAARLDDQMGCLLRVLAEVEPERRRAGLVNPDDVAVAALPACRAVCLEGVERPEDIGDRHRCAIVPIGVLAQRIGYRAVVVSDLDGLGQLAVVGGKFVLRGQQSVSSSSPPRATYTGAIPLSTYGLRLLNVPTMGV